MTDKYQPPYEAKFKPGDYIYFDGHIYLIEEITKISRGWTYNISAQNVLKNIDLEKGDKYFRKA